MPYSSDVADVISELQGVGNSRSVTSNQEDIHPDLDDVVLKHAESRFRRPISEHTQRAFESVQKRVAMDGRPLVLDSGCGVGESTVHLASRHADSLVIGIDQSEHRLSKNPHYTGLVDVKGEHGNLLLLRADCVDFWRLAEQAGWQPTHHYVLYPNPWPKKQHLKRRWHGHPVFPHLLALGGALELRSNWHTYLQEFARALNLHDVDCAVQTITLDDGTYLTPFERKYSQSGQSVYRLTAVVG